MRFPLLLGSLLLAGPALAQTAISITSADMPGVGDSLRLSQAAGLPAGAPALTLNGANKTWNYTGLVPSAQRVERYGTVAAAATGLQLLAFGLPIGANRANLASPRDLGGAAAGLPVSDAHEFYLSTTTDFRSVGYGVTVNGTALPLTYTTQGTQDVLYNLPLTYGTTPTASASRLEVAVPGTGGLSRRRLRSNQSDGWGTLITPFGTYPALRVVTTIIDRDSAVFGTTSIPATTLPTQREYKWLAKGIHVPLLTITTTEVAGTQQVTGVEYRDIYRKIVGLATHSAALETGLGLYPNPSVVGTALRLALPVGSGPLTLTATDVAGRTLFSRRYASPGPEVVLEAATLGDFRGVLLLTVQTSQGTATRRVVRQ